MVASYLIQGAFKETMEALFVLAFAIGLHELAREAHLGCRPGVRRTRGLRLPAVPLAALAVGCVYSYSFPGLLWLAGAAGLWALVELALVARRTIRPAAAVALARRAAPATGVAVAALALAVAPEVGRMVDFASFETFDPVRGRAGQPLQPDLAARGARHLALGRLPPRPGRRRHAGRRLLPRRRAGPGGAGYGLAWWLRRGERAVPAALAVAAALFAYAHFAGTPYQEAKAIVIASPLAMLIAARALLGRRAADRDRRHHAALIARRRGGPSGIAARLAMPLQAALAVAFAGCGGRLQPARARQRPGRPGHVLARAHRAAAGARRRLDPGPRPRAAARRRARPRLPRLGAAGRARLRRSRLGAPSVVPAPATGPLT